MNKSNYLLKNSIKIENNMYQWIEEDLPLEYISFDSLIKEVLKIVR